MGGIGHGWPILTGIAAFGLAGVCGAAAEQRQADSAQPCQGSDNRGFEWAKDVQHGEPLFRWHTLSISRLCTDPLMWAWPLSEMDF